MKFATQAIHVGQEPDPATGATVPPIYATTTYTQESPGRNKGYQYSRARNPTRANLERCLAALEGGQACAAFASGMAATSAVIGSLLRPGDSLVAYADLYGGTYRNFEKVFAPWGLATRYAEVPSPAAFHALMDKTTKLVWVETPTNPLLRLLDVAAIAETAHKAGATLVVDNTFATPALQQPIALGADLVLHSTTKYLGGHSDVIGGAVVAARETDLEPIAFYQSAAGAVPSPFDCFLTHRGIKTLAVRMERHCRNAMAVARWAMKQPIFESVSYPGLADHPEHDLASRQMRGYGGMVTVCLVGGFDGAQRFMEALRIFACAESLGGVESLANHSVLMTHASVPKEMRERMGVVDGLVRLSVGIEDGDDLIADLEQAAAAVKANRPVRSS